jgi:integrase
VASLYTKQNKLWARYKNESGEWSNAPTPYRPGEEAKARRFLARLAGRVAVTVDVAAAAGLPAGPLTVEQYAKKWIDDRRPLGLASLQDDETRLRKHALPHIGNLRLDEVRPRHVRSLIKTLRAAGELAPRTIYHVFFTLAQMFKCAVADELIDVTPCVIVKGDLPKKTDKDPSWRVTAIYTREEVEMLISDLRIPEDRRVLYALKSLAGLRHSEAAELTWRQYDTTLEPLGRIALEHTKTKVPRQVPVHPTLARVLDEWKTAGWERVYGRPPEPGDLITPSRNMTPKDKHESPKQLRADLELLRLRTRRGHDMRRTFITLAQVDGARRDLLETITHGPRGDIVSMYTSFPWPALCPEVAKLQIQLRPAPALDGDGRGLATTFATTATKARNRWRKSVTPPGHPQRYTLEIPVSLVARRTA